MRHLPILITFFITACNSDYSHNLPNGYKLSRFYSGSSAIVSPNSDVIVGPSKYGIVIGVSGKYVLGNLDTEEKAYDAPEVPDRYFVIDTSSGQVFQELSHAAYNGKLNELLIQKTPLYRPNGQELK